MAKKKKKKSKKSSAEKSKKPQVEKAEKPIPEKVEKNVAEGYTLDTALHSTKKTESTLQDLLKGVSSGEGFYRRETEEKQIKPQLIHETKKPDIVSDYLIEDVPITERTTVSTKKRSKSVEEKPEIAIPDKEEDMKNAIKSQPVEQTTKPPVETPSKPPPPVKPANKVPITPVSVPPPRSQPKEESIYDKLTVFFKGYLKGYGERYNQWEAMSSNILAILRKMRKITQKNTEELVKTIGDLYDKVQKGLDFFKMKRSEIEKIAEVDTQNMSGEFKKVLGMLELQVKEYSLKRVTDSYFRIV